MDIKENILGELKKGGKVTSESIAKLCNVSRQAAHAHLSELAREKKLLRIGRTRGSYYVTYSQEKARKLQKEEQKYSINLKNKGLEEDKVYNRIKYHFPAISKLPANTQDIFHYAFTEMLNNAIEYSGSLKISILVKLSHRNIYFKVADKGIGIFKHVKQKFRLKDEYEALEELLKGKKTTMPDKHTGEGIFFTSKNADIFQIQSSRIRLIIDNKKEDIYTEEISFCQGTKICFQLKQNTRKNLEKLFREYTDDNYEFQKTRVTVKLYQKDVKYISRSQARRLILGLDKFRIILLDFNKIKTIGQSFADEIFRVFQSNHPGIKIETINVCKAVDFMIKRSRTG